MSCVFATPDVRFAPNDGIWIHYLIDVSMIAAGDWQSVVRPICAILQIDENGTIAGVAQALRYWQHPYFVERNCSGAGSLYKKWPSGDISLDRFLQLIDECALEDDQRRVDRSAFEVTLAHRRRVFQSRRAELVLGMLDAGKHYRCSHLGCEISENLTVDHIVPLSKGGTDDISNLQFMCGPHNAAKGNRA